MLLNLAPPVTACGSVEPQPIYVFEESPDPPFQEFTNGKIGIVRPSFGRKTLFIAYQYLNGGSFTAEEQNDLVAALKGTAPEDGGAKAVVAWVDARAQFLTVGEPLPKIYGPYNFFPNCTKNAFEVALQTLKDRTASYGADDPHVRTWLAGQDTVFQNCDGPSLVPMTLGADFPMWLRKDRDYQIAAAHFYSLNFEEARARFEKIATDADSPWQSIAGYMVARTFIREGSLGNDEKRKRELFEKAEIRLQALVTSGGQFANASKKLLALVKYHIHPEERVVEISRALTNGNNENLRQDLIDYSWLLDKFEWEIGTAEQERQQKTEAIEGPQPPYAPFPSQEAKDRFERIARGETIELVLFGRNADGSSDYSERTAIEVKYDSSETEIHEAFKQTLSRALSAEDTTELRRTRESALQQRLWRISPNRKLEDSELSERERCNSDCTKLTLDLVPEFLRSDDLSDWILTLQIDDSRAYSHAFQKWRATGSPAWMLTALVKAETSSPKLTRLMQAAERVPRDNPGFPTVAYHLIRLKAAMGQADQAKTLLDEMISQRSEMLPVSAQNQFLEQRMHLARGLNEFLKSAQRKPVAFSTGERVGKFSEFLAMDKNGWDSNSGQTKEDYEREVEENYKHLLPWDERFGFDYQTIDILNWHFPLQLMAEAARNPNLPDYLQRSLVLATWTRAILLNNDEVALKMAPQVIQVEPQLGSVLEPYLKSRTAKERHNIALYALLKFPNLSPLLQGGLPKFKTSEEIEYYFKDSWWCKAETTEYSGGKAIPKVVPRPNFLTAAQLETARREFLALAAIEDGDRYLGKQVIEWAKTSPDDPRIPEALFIAVQANQSNAFSCAGLENDEKTKEEAETILRGRYADSPWTAKLSANPS